MSDMQDRLRKDYATARECLGNSVQRNKRRYDLRSKPQEYQRGMWVWYYYPRRYMGRSPKWQRLFTGPYLIVKMLGKTNVVLQKSARSNTFVAHVDKLKKCFSTTPNTWLLEEVTVAETPSLTDLPVEGDLEQRLDEQPAGGDHDGLWTPTEGSADVRDAGSGDGLLLPAGEAQEHQGVERQAEDADDGLSAWPDEAGGQGSRGDIGMDGDVGGSASQRGAASQGATLGHMESMRDEERLLGGRPRRAIRRPARFDD